VLGARVSRPLWEARETANVAGETPALPGKRLMAPRQTAPRSCRRRPPLVMRDGAKIEQDGLGMVTGV
jgi:hypothetical protein